MPSFAAFFQSKGGQAANLAQSGDDVSIVFTDPPDRALFVEIRVIEVPEKGEASGERELLLVEGTFLFGKFNVDSFRITSTIPGDPHRAPQIGVQVGDGTVNQLGLPDDRPEGGRFDLRLDVKGQIDGETKHQKGVALLHVEYKMDVMIIPAANGVRDKALGLIRTWATQWRARAPATRAIVELALDPKPLTKVTVDADFAGFIAAVTRAGKLAHGGAIGLAVGHGDDGGPNGFVNAVAWTNLVPEDRLPDADETYHYRLSIDEVEIADGIPKPIMPIVSPPVTAKLHALTVLGDFFSTLQPPIEEFRLLTCNVAGNATFLQRLADRMRVTMRAYQDFLVFEGFAGVHPVYYYTQKEPPPTQTEVHTREWPSASLSSKVPPGAPPPPF